MTPVLLALLPSPAWGHAGASVAAIDVDATDPAVTLVEGNFGLLLGQEGRWDWVCHEAITTAEATIAPRYLRTAGGTLLGVVPDETQAREAAHRVYRSDDGGCSWDPVLGLAGEPVVALAASPVDAQRLAAVTEGDGAVLLSTDGGATWTEALAPASGRDFTSLRWSAQGTLWATGQEAAGLLVVVHGSPEDLAVHTLSPPPVDGEGQVELVLLAASPTNPDQAWLGVGPTTGDALWRTDDGGRSVVELAQLDGELVDGDVGADGTIWVLEGSRAPWVSTDGSSFEELGGVPLGIGLQAGADHALTTSFAEYTGVLLVKVEADGTWRDALLPTELDGPLACVDNTEQRELCEPLWAEVEASLSIYLPADTGQGGAADSGRADDAGQPVEGEGCGCAAGGGPGGLLAVLGLLVMGRRRGVGTRQPRTP